MSHIVVVDDQSERVKYYGPWTHDTSDNAVDALDKTLSFASQNGAGAVFEFYGTYVNVNGGILLEDSAGPVPAASFAIDGGEPHIYTAPDSYNTTWANNLYSSHALSDGPHTLNITLLGSGSPWVFDVFLYNGTEEATTTAAAVMARQATVVDTVTVAATPSEAAAAPAPAAPRADVPVGPIVGGVVGGVALLVCSAMAFYFLYWKRRGHGRGQERPYSYQRAEKADLFDAEDLRPPVHVYHYQRAATPSTASLAQSSSTPRPYSTASLAQSPFTPRLYSTASLAHSPSTPRLSLAHSPSTPRLSLAQSPSTPRLSLAQSPSTPRLPLAQSPTTPRPHSYSNATLRLEPYVPLPVLSLPRAASPQQQQRDDPRQRQDSYAASTPSEYSASSMSRSTTYTVTNPDAHPGADDDDDDDDATADGHGHAAGPPSLAVRADTLTPAQRKAAEALAERLATVQQHMDVDAGYRRFDDAETGGSGSGARGEVLPVYSEK